MSFAFYNTIAFSHTRLLHHVGTVKLDASNNYLYTEYRLTLAGVYNPAVNAYLLNGAGFPSPAPGAIAPQTCAALRHALSQPRQPFGYVAGNWLMIYAPPLLGVRGFTQVNVPPVNLPPPAPVGPAGVGTGVNAGLQTQTFPGFQISLPTITQKFAAVDCANGPFPSPPEIVESIGDKTFLVRFTVTLALNETAPNNTKPGAARAPTKFPTSPLLGNAYSVTDVVDQDFFTSRYVEGTAVFRSDALQVLKLFPDQFRYWLGHPIPPRFRRENIRVRQEADGVTTHYSFIDRERVLNFDPNVFTRVEMTISQDEDQPGLETLFRKGAGPVLDAVAGIGGVERLLRRLPGIGGFFRTYGGFFGGVTALGATAVRIAFALANVGLPVTNYRIVGRFWGHALQNRAWLERVALNAYRQMIAIYGLSRQLIALTGFAVPNFVPLLAGRTLQLADIRFRTNADLSGMFVEYDQEVVGSRLQTFLGWLLQNPPAGAGAAPTQVRPILLDPMRGTYLGGAVASALRNSSDLWAQTGVAPSVRDTEVDRSGTFIFGTGRPAINAAGGPFSSFPDGTNVTGGPGQANIPTRPGATLP